MTTTHPHLAAPYELQAADEGRLKAIAFPLLPEPEFNPKTKEWQWRYGLDAYARFKDIFPTHLIGLSAFTHNLREGDHIYLAEKWCKGDWGTAFDDDIYFTESTTPEAENIGWQPASTMPQEAAQHWFAIASVRVCQCKDLATDLLVATGLIDPQDPSLKYPKVTKPIDISSDNPDLLAHAAQAIKEAQCASRWNTAYPDYRWRKDRWLVALEVETIS